MIKKSISLTDKQNEWIKSQISNGDYGNDSEVIRDLIRQKQARNAELQSIRSSLIEAEQSEFSDKTAEEIRQETKAKLKMNA